MKRYATASLIMLLVAALVIPAFGHEFGREKRPGMARERSGGEYGRMYHDGNTKLTTEQSQEMKALHDRYLEDITPLRSDLFAKRSELRLLWNKETPDGDLIKAKTKEISTIRDQLTDKRIDYRLAVRKIIPSDDRQGFRGDYHHRGFKDNNDRHGRMGTGGMRW